MNAESEGRAKAARFREDHHLGLQPLGDLVAVIEQATGIDVAVLDAGPDEHVLTMRDQKRSAVFIGVARTRHSMRQRSTLAHELGHVLFEDWAADNSDKHGERSFIEIRADAFARHVLVPADGLRDFLGERTGSSQAILSAVVQRFLVSPAIAAIALHQAGYIDAATKQEWNPVSTRHLAVRFGWSDQYHALRVGSDRHRAPQRLLARAIRGYVEGALPLQAIATLRGISAGEVEAELAEAGIVPGAQPIAWADAHELPDVQVDLAALDEDLNRADATPDVPDH